MTFFLYIERRPNSDPFYIDSDPASLLLVEAVPRKPTGTLKVQKGRGGGRKYQLNTSGKVPSEGPSYTMRHH